jgi:hypothetical protein
MNHLAITVECSPPDAKGGKKIGPIKKTILLDPNIKISEATRVLLDKFGLTHDKEASNFAICIKKDSPEGKAKYLIFDPTRVVSTCLNTKV